MRNTLIYGIILIVSAVSAVADEANDRTQIQTARELWMKAFYSGDTETMGRMETDDFVAIARDIISDKKTQLAKIKEQKDSGNWFPPGLTGVDLEVTTRFAGKNVAIVSGHVANKVPGEEKPRNQFAVTEIWRRTDDGWRVAHLHFHPLTEPQEDSEED